MAAVFVIIFLFALASTSLFLNGISAASLGSMMAGAAFLALAAGVFLGLYRMVKHWENEAPTD
jgi:hypothetical protein